MQLELNTADLDFVAQAREFIDHHWPEAARRSRAGAMAGRGDAAESAWFRALAERGWAVPRWPVAEGGTGWSSLWHYLWERETALAEAPERDSCGVRLVGPLLANLGTPAQRATHLPRIRDGRVRWCCAAGQRAADSAHSAAGAGVPAFDVMPEGTGYRLQSREPWITSAARADWLLCEAQFVSRDHDADGAAQRRSQRQGLFLVDLQRPGVTLQPLGTLVRSMRLARIRLESVLLPPDALVQGPGAAASPLRGWIDAATVGGAAAARFRIQAQRLRALAAATPDGAARLVDDAAFSRKLAALEVQLAGLEALELRALARPADPAFAAALAPQLTLRRAALGRSFGELWVEALGYYALPFADPLLIDNEGPIGHDVGLIAFDDMLRSQGWFIDGGAEEIHRNRIARAALGV